jgi:formylglycine-generating enzyme required for sulfatase activity
MKTNFILIALLALCFCSCASSGLNERGPSAGGRSDEMVIIPESTFQMGRNGAGTNEAPEHTVFLGKYKIDKYEVSAEDFARFLNEKGNGGDKYFTADEHSTIVETTEPVGKNAGVARTSYAARKGFEYYPANNVSWFGADEYCRWKGRRLPTEAEWEKAARGEDGRRYPWGDAPPTDETARYHQVEAEGPDALAPVDSLKEGASFYGVYNMAGNVLEWVNDWYRQNYCEFCGQSEGEYVKAVEELLCVDKNTASVRTRQEKSDTVAYNDPQGPEVGSFKVLRGGSWHDKTGPFLRATRRFWLGPEERYSYTGFRCAQGRENAARIATPDEVRRALLNCLPEEAKPVVPRIN